MAYAQVVLSYDTQSEFCGGTVTGRVGRIGIPRMTTSMECEWQIANVPGSNVVLSLDFLKLPETDFCADSYVEIRQFNSSGPLIGRFCNASYPRTLTKENFWIRMRYMAPEINSGDLMDDRERRGSISFRYTKVVGGLTESHTIESPPPELLEVGSAEYWQIATSHSENYIRLTVDEFSVEGDKPVYIFDVLCDRFESSCNDDIERAIVLQGMVPPEDKVFVIKSNIATIRLTPASKHVLFRFTWTEIGPHQVNESDIAPGTTDTPTDFTCGGELKVSHVTQTLRNPANANDVYADNLRCKWVIRRPMFSGIHVKLTELDMEEEGSCNNDYLLVTPYDYTTLDELVEAGHYDLNCKKEQVGTEIAESSEKEIFIYFVSDSSTSFNGFTLEYRL
ncbi:calcium binding EGF domain-containing protein, partial [Aphelenchoides avenae]